MKIHIPAFEPMAKCKEHLKHGPIDIDLGPDVVKVVRCKNCIYYHPAHVLTDSGEEKGYEDMQPEAFDPLGTGLVTSEYGVNVGGQCERNRYDADDKTVFCGPDDFCSRGQRREEDCGDRVDKN